MSATASKNELKSLEERLDTRFDEVLSAMSQFATDVDARFNKIEARFDEYDAKFDRLLTTIDRFVKRIDHYETELAARDHKIARLERWIEEIAKQTGVKLPN